MANAYKTLRNKHQDEVNAFPMFFCFDRKQFEEGMATLGLGPNDTDKIYSFGNTGGYFKRTDAPRLHEMLDRHENERKEAMASDKTGVGYIYDMFCYQLSNHEYAYTMNAEPALDALDLTLEDVEKNPVLSKAFQRAKKNALSDDAFAV